MVTVIGLILMPVPGPGGTPVTLAGLAILATELPWAKRLMDAFIERTKVLHQNRSRRWKLAVGVGAVGFYLVAGLISYNLWSKASS